MAITILKPDNNTPPRKTHYLKDGKVGTKPYPNLYKFEAHQESIHDIKSLSRLLLKLESERV
jgi:hypothetical protein